MAKGPASIPPTPAQEPRSQPAPRRPAQQAGSFQEAGPPCTGQAPSLMADAPGVEMSLPLGHSCQCGWDEGRGKGLQFAPGQRQSEP